MKKSISIYVVLAIVAIAFVFTGCGGGGGGGGSTSGGEENKSPTAITGPNQTVAEGTLVTLDASNSTDPDDGIISYLWEQTGGPSVTLSSFSSVKPTFTTPDVGPGGAALTFRLTVTDKGGLKSTATCIVNVTATNDPPMAEAGSDQTVDEGAAVTLDGSGSTDPDDGIASYLWEQTGGPSVSLSDSGSVKPTFTAPFVDSGAAALTFKLTVTDMGGLKSSDTCIVNVTFVDKPPVAEAGLDQTVYAGTLVSLDGSASSDPDNDAISCQWQQTGGPAVTLTNSNSSIAQFTASVAAGSVLIFQLTVSDNWGLQSSDTCTVTVQENPKKLVQTALYTAYAGIGYGRANYTAPDDDEFLYNVMLDDLNTVTGNLVMDTIFYDTNVLAKLINLALGITTTFNYTYPSGATGSIKVNPGALVNGYRSFAADLTVDFNATAYPWEACNYYGPDAGVDLTAHVTGYFKATTVELEELFLSSVVINPQPSLKAVYPKGEVRYNLWKISYKAYYGTVDPTYPDVGSDTPVNMKVVPTLITEPVSDVDFRDYDVSGGFSLNGSAYTFGSSGESVKYQQEQENGLTLIYISGKIAAPGLTGPVTVSTPAEIPAVRNIYGLWISGQMNFTGLTGASQVVFSSSYSCTFSGGSQGSWTVAGWQNALEP